MLFWYSNKEIRRIQEEREEERNVEIFVRNSRVRCDRGNDT